MLGPEDILSGVQPFSMILDTTSTGESLNIQDVKTNLFSEFRKFTSQDGESMESYYSRIAKKCKIQLALHAAAQPYSDTYYQAPKPQRSNTTSSSTRQSASTRHKQRCRQTNYNLNLIRHLKKNMIPEQAQSDRGNAKGIDLKIPRPRYKQHNQSRAVLGIKRDNDSAGTQGGETVGSPVLKQGVQLQADQAMARGHGGELINRIGRTLQFYGKDLGAPKCATYNGRSTFANPKYLKIAQSEKPCLYEIQYDTSDHANRFFPNGEETVTLKKESRSKLNKDTVKPYDYTYQNSLYEIFKPPSKTYLDQLERAKEIRKTMWRRNVL
ncbi:hypothetical protein Tco_0432214 [Tanacetum coccineum]